MRRVCEYFTSTSYCRYSEIFRVLIFILHAEKFASYALEASGRQASYFGLNLNVTFFRISRISYNSKYVGKCAARISAYLPYSSFFVVSEHIWIYSRMCLYFSANIHSQAFRFFLHVFRDFCDFWEKVSYVLLCVFGESLRLLA